MSLFKKASKKEAKLRLAIQGASGSGKTWSSLILAQSLGKKIAVVDTEKGSASLYSDKFEFDVLELPAGFHTPEHYIKAITEAEQEGYDVLVIDSITHEWQACLDLVTAIGGNSFTAWGKITPRHNKFVNAILSSKMHIIATMRSKQDYVLQDRNGKQVPTKVGMASVQREGLDYEFTMVFELNENHVAKATKDRSGIFDGKDFEINEDTGNQILSWLNVDKPKENKEFKPEEAFELSDEKKDFIEENKIY